MEIAKYCYFDVKTTEELHEYGRVEGEIFCLDRSGKSVT